MANQLVQQAIEASLLQAAQAMEDQLDSQLHQLENLDEDDLERVRQRRIDEMKRCAGGGGQRRAPLGARAATTLPCPASAAW